MSVEFTPVNKHCFCFGVANATWFHLLKTSKIKDILKNPDFTNDPIKVSKKQALLCLEAIQDWQPSEPWFSDKPEQGKEMFMTFFKQCNGFSTH